MRAVAVARRKNPPDRQGDRAGQVQGGNVTGLTHGPLLVAENSVAASGSAGSTRFSRQCGRCGTVENRKAASHALSDLLTNFTIIIVWEK